MGLERNNSDEYSVYSGDVNQIGPLDYCVTSSIEDSFYPRKEIDIMVQELKNEIKDLKDSMITEEDRRRTLGVESFFDLHADDDEETEDIPVLTTESTEDIDDEDLDSDDLTIDDLKDIEFSEKDFGIDPDSFIDPEE